MYINRALLMMVAVAFTFFPMIAQWVTHSGPEWYRPYQVWLLIVVAAYWNQRSRANDEL